MQHCALSRLTLATVRQGDVASRAKTNDGKERPELDLVRVIRAGGLGRV